MSISAPHCLLVRAKSSLNKNSLHSELGQTETIQRVSGGGSFRNQLIFETAPPIFCERLGDLVGVVRKPQQSTQKGRFTTSSSGRGVNATFKRWNSPGQTIPTRLRNHPHVSRDLCISLPIECSQANSDVVWVFRHPRKHGRPATRTKAPPSAGRRFIFRNQIFASNYTIPFKWNSRVGRKGCAVGASAKVAVAKPNLTEGSQNLELEAATEAA
jgi:hypothetical protein